eukprot:1717044-Pyramimonas_sp.AAC.1
MGPQERAPMSTRHALERKREEAETNIKGASSNFKEKVEEARKKRLEEQKTKYRKGGRTRAYKSIYPSGGWSTPEGQRIIAETLCEAPIPEASFQR